MTNTDDETHILKLSDIIHAMLCSTVLTNLSMRSDSFLDTAVLSRFFFSLFLSKVSFPHLLLPNWQKCADSYADSSYNKNINLHVFCGYKFLFLCDKGGMFITEGISSNEELFK